MSRRRGVVIDWHDINDRESHPEARNLVARAGRERDEDFHRANNAEWRSRQGHTALPVVLFANGSTVIINPHTWTIEIDRDNYLARTQLPLALAWAMTCHKVRATSSLQGRSMLRDIGSRKARVWTGSS